MDTHPVGGIIDRRGLNRNLQGISVESDDLVSGRSWLNINIENDALGRFLKKMHGFWIGDKIIR